MDINETESLHNELMQNNQMFRQLATEHMKYETRLDELSSLHYPNDEEQLEESVLKKKKLVLKDQMYEMMMSHSKSQINH